MSSRLAGIQDETLSLTKPVIFNLVSLEAFCDLFFIECQVDYNEISQDKGDGAKGGWGIFL